MGETPMLRYAQSVRTPVHTLSQRKHNVTEQPRPRVRSGVKVPVNRPPRQSRKSPPPPRSAIKSFLFSNLGVVTSLAFHAAIILLALATYQVGKTVIAHT